MAIFAVSTQKGPNWDHNLPIREQEGFEAHAAFADDLVERGVIVAGGPIDGGPEDIALIAVEASNEEEVRSIFSFDPWAVNGVFRIGDVRHWTWWLDGRKSPSPEGEGPSGVDPPR